MINRTSPWPHPLLTPQESQGCALYRTVLPDKTVVPGILRRVYPFQLRSTLIAGEQSVLAVTFVTSGLKTLLHGITFSGDIEFWEMSLRTASGQILFDTTPVTALLNLPYLDGSSMPSNAGTNRNDVLLRPNAPPKTWDPAWVIDGTQALLLEGAPLGATYVAGATDRGVLNIALHVWEIPGSNNNRGPVAPTPQMPPRPMIPALRIAPGGRKV